MTRPDAWRQAEFSFAGVQYHSPTVREGTLRENLYELTRRAALLLTVGS